VTIVGLRDGDRAAVRVEQELGGVESLSALRRVGTVDAIAVDLSGPQIRNERVPVVVAAMAGGVEPDDA
jgi:hypothetical protein